jgi:anthranilate synthase component 2/putative glutamine amidotransferase
VTVRPLIGISTYREQARWGSWDVPAVLLPANYADAVAECGGEPVLLPTGASSADVVARLDGLVLAGGADVDPARYGQPAGEHTTVLRPERDEAELALLTAARDRDLPLLAVCRGMQLLNVLLGGDLVQHLPDVPGVRAHAAGPGVFARREVTTVAGTGVAALLGPTASADCHHHQALGTVADGLVPAGWAEDGVLEAVEIRGARFGIGVQWHPEAGDDRRLFGALVEAAHPERRNRGL